MTIIIGDFVNILNEKSKPLGGLLAGTTAIIRGECVGICSNNAALGQFIKENSYRDTIVQAIFDVTGKRYRLAISRSEGRAAAQTKKADPLDALIKKVQDTDVNVNIK